jgi:hypothetical protein
VEGLSEVEEERGSERKGIEGKGRKGESKGVEGRRRHWNGLGLEAKHLRGGERTHVAITVTLHGIVTTPMLLFSVSLGCTQISYCLQMMSFVINSYSFPYLVTSPGDFRIDRKRRRSRSILVQTAVWASDCRVHVDVFSKARSHVSLYYSFPYPSFTTLIPHYNPGSWNNKSPSRDLRTESQRTLSLSP